jgi:vancomycin resistance protein YoaR
METMELKKKNEDGNKKKIRRTPQRLLVSILLVLIAVLAVIFVVEYVKVQKENARIMANELALAGVSVNGIDISGMAYDEALLATEGVPSTLLEAAAITIDVEGETFPYAAEELGFYTDYDDVLQEAMLYGNTGTLEERKAAIEIAATQGVTFSVKVQADRTKVSESLLKLKQKLDVVPVDATMTFMPWGYLPDGTAYVQDQQEMIKAAAKGKMWQRPELVRMGSTDMPPSLRYEFWNTKKYSDNNIPVDASISRFFYTQEKRGRSVDMEAVIDEVINAVQTDSFSTIAAPVQTLEPSVTLESLKKGTQLVSSWTSSYSSHNGYNRNWNVAKLSGIINGTVLQPGEEFSVNGKAGDRRTTTGWLDAAGIVNGGYVDQPGGGVCQISSTLYNAVIRANLEVTDSTHHSLSSDYIPLGLDATISSGAPDLKFKNNYDVPVYIVSYVDPEAKTATVEIYGPTVVDATYGDVILRFSFADGGTYGSPVMTYVYNTQVIPETKEALAPGASLEYAKLRYGRSVTTYIHYLSLDGKELDKKLFAEYTWPPKNGRTYVNAPDPSIIVPTPTLVPEP